MDGVGAALADALPHVAPDASLWQTAAATAHAAMQEDVDVIGLSLLSGAHMTLFMDVALLVKEKKMSDVLIVGGGIIPEEDTVKLKKAGITEVFGPGTPVEDIVKFIEKNVKR